MSETDPIFVIGDVHGQIDALEDAIALIHDDPDAGAPVVFLGDYLDRGPDSRAVVQLLIDGLVDGEPWIILKGNHDRYLPRFLADPTYRDPRTRNNLGWLDEVIGGRATLASYGVDASKRRKLRDIHADALDAIPKEHVAFLNSLALVHETPSQIFVHAGLRPGVALADQSEDDLLWIRSEFLHHTGDFGRLVVHGHTPIDLPVHHGNRLNMDGGAGYGRPIIPAVLHGRRGWTLSDSGRLPL